MKYNRRQFLDKIGKPVAAAIPLAFINPFKFTEIKESLASENRSPKALASDESFWFKVQQAYMVDRSIINLNSGGVSPSPTVVHDALKRYLDYSNTAPVYAMWKILEPQREGVRQKMTKLFKCDPEEIAFTRNASEGLQICQNGFDLKPGDEVLTTTQDYGRMIRTWEQRERRDKIVLKQISIPVPCEDDNKIVELFERGITAKTRLIMMCHMINLTGQILPVKKVVQMARKKGIPVIVDGAHTFAHFPFDQKDLDCDYYAASLHKWLNAPIGTGLFYVKKDKIKELWPMQAAAEKMDNDIRKFEEIGTHPAANYLAIADAISFYLGIGPERKAERLRYLKDLWAKRLTKYDNVKLNTSLNPKFSCGIGNVHVQGIDPQKVTKYLWDKQRIIVVGINHAEFEGIRISPNLFTTIEEIDRLCETMEQVIKNGISES
jgi:isopenicillin-N epimerase